MGSEVSRDRRRYFATSRVAHASVIDPPAGAAISEGLAQRVACPVLNMHAAPDSAGLDRQLLLGAEVICLETDGAWAFVRDEAMGHVGWVAAEGLAPPLLATHRVSARSTFVFAAAAFKSPNPVALSFGARLAVAESEGQFAQLASGGCVPTHHITPLGSVGDGAAKDPIFDPVSVAELHLGTPYLWGGNSAFGIDCSGLVQVALAACGLDCPADSDQQARELGVALDPGTPPQRGDLMFWKGHVAWVADPETLIHANVHAMAVAYEPITSAIARIEAQGEGPVTAHRRLAPLP